MHARAARWWIGRIALGAVAAMAMNLALGAAGHAATPASEQVRRGAYLAAAGDCAACHTAQGGAPFAGGRYMPTPFGEIATPNITPAPRTGIGAWTDDQFYRAMHDGIGHRGEYLYPVMPFPWYTIVTREDVDAIRAYLKTVPAVEQPRQPNRLHFPANLRSSLLAWRKLFFEPRHFTPDPSQSEQVNRGNYLVNGLAHCGECHNGRPALGATSSHRGALAGGVIDNWYAPNITSDPRSGIGDWTEQQIARYLKTGEAPHGGVAAGPMAQTVHSLSKLSDDDLLAIAAYLKTTDPQPAPAGRPHALYRGAGARGGDVYVSFCASCHGADGEGLPDVVPALDGNGAVQAAGPQDVINVVLGGLQARRRHAPMLAIGAGMSDEQIADVVNFVRQNWHNHAPPTAQPGLVARLRAASATSLNPESRSDCTGTLLTPRAERISRQLGVDDHGLAGVDGAALPARAAQLMKQARQRAPNASDDELVNALTARYCRALFDGEPQDRSRRTLRLGHFSELAYSAATGQRFR